MILRTLRERAGELLALAPAALAAPPTTVPVARSLAKDALQRLGVAGEDALTHREARRLDPAADLGELLFRERRQLVGNAEAVLGHLRTLPPHDESPLRPALPVVDLRRHDDPGGVARRSRALERALHHRRDAHAIDLAVLL